MFVNCNLFYLVILISLSLIPHLYLCMYLSWLTLDVNMAFISVLLIDWTLEWLISSMHFCNWTANLVCLKLWTINYLIYILLTFCIEHRKFIDQQSSDFIKLEDFITPREFPFQLIFSTVIPYVIFLDNDFKKDKPFLNSWTILGQYNIFLFISLGKTG